MCAWVRACVHTCFTSLTSLERTSFKSFLSRSRIANKIDLSSRARYRMTSLTPEREVTLRTSRSRRSSLEFKDWKRSWIRINPETKVKMMLMIWGQRSNRVDHLKTYWHDVWSILHHFEMCTIRLHWLVS